MLHNPLDNRALYNMYDFTMRSLQPYCEYSAILAKRYKRIADTLDLPLTIPFMSDEQKQWCSALMQNAVGINRRLAASYYIQYMLTKIYDKPTFDIQEIK